MSKASPYLLQPRLSSSFGPIVDVLKTRRYRWMILGIGLAYALTYMVFVGVISYVPTLKTANGMPVVNFYAVGVASIPADGIWIFFFYWAIAFIAVSSFLVGLNIVLMFYARKVSKGSCSISSIGPRGIFGILPAFLTPAICCGGGLLALTIGATAFSYLAANNQQLLAPLTIAALAAGTYLMSSKIGKTERRC